MMLPFQQPTLADCGAKIEKGARFEEYGFGRTKPLGHPAIVILIGLLIGMQIVGKRSGEMEWLAIGLTGETYPVDKLSGVLPAETGLNQRANSPYMGTNVISGTAKAVDELRHHNLIIS